MDTAEWVVIPANDGYIVSRNGEDGIPEIVDHYYLERQQAEEIAEWLNDTEEND